MDKGGWDRRRQNKNKKITRKNGKIIILELFGWNDKKEGECKTYYDTGNIKHIDVYKDGKRVSRKKYDRQGNLASEQNIPEGAE